MFGKLRQNCTTAWTRYLSLSTYFNFVSSKRLRYALCVTFRILFQGLKQMWNICLFVSLLKRSMIRKQNKSRNLFIIKNTNNDECVNQHQNKWMPHIANAVTFSIT